MKRKYTKPNNILAIEYLKSIKTTNSGVIKPFAMGKRGILHNDEKHNENYIRNIY